MSVHLCENVQRQNHVGSLDALFEPSTSHKISQLTSNFSYKLGIIYFLLKAKNNGSLESSIMSVLERS